MDIMNGNGLCPAYYVATVYPSVFSTKENTGIFTSVFTVKQQRTAPICTISKPYEV